MKKLVNLNKRSIQLPGGAKDLIDVLSGRRKRSKGKSPQKSLGPVQCEYCDALAVPFTIMGTEIFRYCKECATDLTNFARSQNYSDYDPSDEKAATQYRADIIRRQEEFMRQQVKDRKAK